MIFKWQKFYEALRGPKQMVDLNVLIFSSQVYFLFQSRGVK